MLVHNSSFTAFTYLADFFGFCWKKFGVCSRKIWLKTRSKNYYWEMADRLRLKQKLIGLSNAIIIQGEIVGPPVQENKYNKTERDLYVFNVFKNGNILSLENMEEFCANQGLTTVPILNRSFVPSRDIGEGKEVSDVVKAIMLMSQGDSTLFKRNREGIVVRLKSNPNVSFKAINPYFEMEEK